MDSSLPFFLFFMKKMMTGFIGMDFQRGLNLLKDYSEDDKVHSKLDFSGRSTFNGMKFIGIKTNCTMKELSKKMSGDFEKIRKYADENKDAIKGDFFSIYHKWDMANGKVSYTSGVSVNNEISNLPTEFIKGEIPNTGIYSIKHTGPYLHLGNAWGTLYNMQRAKTFKMNKKVDPFEVYHNLPGEVDDRELITEVHFPVK